MNGLTLRISGGSKSRAPIAALPPVTLPLHYAKHIQNLDPKYEAFTKSSSAEHQLMTLKDILNSAVITEDTSKFLALVFLSSEPKHPIKCYLARHITKTTSIQRSFQDNLTQELLKKLSPDHNGISEVTETVTAVISCSDNFPTGSSALKTCEIQLFTYCSRALSENLGMLQNNLSLSPTDKNKILNLTHNILRALLSVVHKLDAANMSTVQALLPDIYQSMVHLFAEKEVPMDTKSLCAIMKVTMLSLEHGQDYWTKFLSTVQETPCEDTESAINAVCMYSAVVTIVPIQQLELTDVDGTSCVQTLAREVLKLSEKYSVEPLVALCVARTLLSLTKALQKSPGTTEGIASAVSILSFVWAHVEHFMDSVRHLTSQVLANVLKYFGKHQNNGFPKVFDIFFSELITLPVNKKAYYVGLSASASMLGTEEILKRIPGLIQSLIDMLSNQAVQANVATTMTALLHRHTQTSSSEQVYDAWIRPILRRVYDSAQSQNMDTPTLNILENIVAKAVGWDANIIRFILPEAKTMSASQKMTIGDLNCTLVCLNLARRMGSLDNVASEGDKWKGILSYDVIRTAVVNSSEEIRILALSLLIETSKSTEPFTLMEFELLLVFLKYNINTQAPNLRHLTLSLMKKLMNRLESSHRVVKRHNSSPGKGFSASSSNIYTEFLGRLREQCFDSLVHGANYSRRAIALQILVWCEHLVLDGYQSSWNEDYVQKLLLHLEDSYENNKSLALEVLTHCPAEFFINNCTINQNLSHVLRQASLVKPTECVSAAYKLQLIQKIPHRLPNVLSEYKGNTASSEQVTCTLIRALWSRLKAELDAARGNILVTASHGPMYGLIFCARHLLANIDAKKIATDDNWTALISDLITTSFVVTSVVAPVVNNSSPEGHLPMDGQAGADHLAGNGLMLDDGVRVTAQMVLLCAWRSVKEVSLLLGEISSRLHIRGECKDDPNSGNLSHQDMLLIGDHFTTLLAETKHRGAFEQAYVGFTKLCARLWKCSSAELHGLPRAWLCELMEAIASGDRSGKLCATRRSAGVPFMIQALVTTELQVVGNPTCFHECMETLLGLASFQSCSAVTVETRTHCLNILRAMFRHTALGEVVNSYVGSGLVTAIRGFDGTTWAERNSATLLFSSLMVRIFGVQRSKDSDKLCIRNKMTGRTFFLRYPGLYDFMLEKLQELGCCEGSRDLLHPSLYPVLLLLARLYPYSLEESTTNLKLVAFIPHVQACGGSCVLKTRHLAAKAIVPLISHDKYFYHLNELLKMLGDRNIKRNFCHGILLQLIRLLEWKPENLKVEETDHSRLSASLHQTLWILEEVLTCKPCYITADEYVKLLNLMLWRFPLAVKTGELTHKVKTVLLKLFHLESPVNLYGKDVFFANAFSLHVLILLNLDRDSVYEIIVRELKNSSYDVVQSVLDTLLLLHREIGDECSCKIQKHIQEITNDNTKSVILAQLEQNETFKQNLFCILQNNLNLECTQKVLTILSYYDDTQAGLLGLDDSNTKCEDIISSLLEKIEREHENVSHIYIVSLHRYLAKIFKEDVGFDEKLWLEIARMLYESCTCDNTDRTRENVVNFLKDHILSITSVKFTELSDNVCFEYLATIWATLINLLEDDEEHLRQTTSNMILSLARSLNMDTQDTHQVIPSRAAEVLLDVVEAVHRGKEAVAMLAVLALLDFTSQVAIRDDSDITDECRVFDHNEKYNLFLEELNWTEECSKRIRKIQDSESTNIKSIIDSDVYNVAFNQLCFFNYFEFHELLSRGTYLETVDPKMRIMFKNLYIDQ